MVQRFKITATGLDIGLTQPFRDAAGNSYPSNWTSIVSAEDMAAIGMEAYEQATPPVEPKTKVYKSDIWRRMTDAEADIADAALNSQSARLRRLWADSGYLLTTDELFPLVAGALGQAFGAARAAEILMPTE